MIKKADIILLIVLLLFGISVSWISLSDSVGGQQVRITVDGKLYGIYRLDQDREIDILQDNHMNHITIKDGSVAMTSSSCKNQICVETGAVSHAKDLIVCLPNKVLIEIVTEDSKGGGVDVITG